MIQIALPLLAVATIVSTPKDAHQAQARSAPPATVRVEEPQQHDFSWYPFEQRPPFVGELVEADHEDVIWAGNAIFTPEDELETPEALTKPLRRGGFFEPGYFVLHFEGGVRAGDKEMLDQLSGRVQRADGSSLARWYVPNNALVAWVPNETVYHLLEGSLRVDWLGRYQPAWKLDRSIGSFPLTSPERVGRAFYRLNVDLIPGHNPAAAAVAIANAGGFVQEHIYLRGAKTHDVSFLVVDAAPEAVAAIAQVEGVRMIQETGDGKRTFDLSGGGKLQNRTLSADDQSASPIVTSSAFPLWLTHNLQGQGQMIGVVDTSIDWNNTGTAGCGFGYPDLNIDNWGFALPNLSSLLHNSVGSGGVNLKIPRAAILGGATLQGNGTGQHGQAAAGAALGDFYGNNDTKWWEHDVDTWEGWAPTNYSGLMGPGIAHEAQLFFAPTDNDSGAFRWEFAGEFEANMNTALDQMAAAGVSTTNHSVGIVEAANTYTQTSVTHDTNAFDHPDMLQCMAAGNDGAGANKLSSQAVVKNALTVGASDDVLQAENRVSFSSTGPRFDGALKPDVMAPGNDEAPRAGGVQSLLILPDSNGSGSGSCAYQYTAGTSFASPIAAGAGALVHQYFEEGRYPGNTAITDASAALMKACLINAGHRLTGANLGDGTYPNDYQGWGEPSLMDVLDFGTGSRRLVAYDVSSAGGFTSSGSSNDTYDITVNGSGERLRVSLVWTDEPGSSGSGKKLINDLDLRVVSPGGTTYRGNVINGSSGESTSGGSADTLNNVENVILSSPQTGTWTVTVDPGAGNYSVGQGYALVITGDVAEGGAPPAPPVAAFSGSPTSGTSPLNVSFSDSSTGNITSWSWSFGDSGSSTAQNPSHTYLSAGTYTVSLTVTGPGGNDTETKTNYVTVTEPAPVAEFSGSPTSGLTPLNVNFSDASTGSITSRSWTFGDGGSSTATNPSHTYTTAGTYTVSLTVTGPGGNDTETKTNYITVTDTPAPPVADFSGTPTSGDAPLLVDFTDLSSGTVTSWSWTFGDGGSSTAQHPSHTYTSAGTYTVSLTATGPGGSDGETKTNYITVTDPPAGGALYYMSFLSNTSVPGLGTVRDEDVVTYDPATDTWAWYFDASDVGVTADVNALHVLDDGTLVLSFNTAISIPGLTGGPSGTSVDDSDLVLFTFTQSGANTAGSFQFIFDGSDVGLTSNGEDIDGVYEFPGGGLGISTLGNPSVPGVSGDADEDVLLFTATQYGSTTTGTWSMYFDGSDVGFGGNGAEDLDAVAFDNGVDLLFSTAGSYSASGSTGDDEDVSRFSGTFGTSTSGSVSLVLDLSALGIDTSEDVDALHYQP